MVPTVKPMLGSVTEDSVKPSPKLIFSLTYAAISSYKIWPWKFVELE